MNQKPLDNYIFQSRPELFLQLVQIYIGMFEQEVFQQGLEEKEQNIGTYSDYLEADEYVSQFLTIYDIAGPKLGEPQHSKDDIEEIPEIMEQSAIQSIPEEKQTKKRSCFHNFQKHLVTTVRSLIDPETFFHGQNIEQNKCGKVLWNCFNQSKKLNKTLLCVLFGNFSSISSQKVSDYGFDQLTKSYSQEIIQKVQNNLKFEILKQLDQIDLAEIIIDRRLRNKKQFEAYFTGFKQQLRKGNLDRRMTKWTKLIKQQMNI